jgi:hypothetical protein
MKLKGASVRRFNITASQYEMFRFIIARNAKLRIRVLATAPVNLLLLDPEDKFMFEEKGSDYTSYTASWPRKSDFETTIPVDAGTWYLVVEGSMDPSTGRVDVFEE